MNILSVPSLHNSLFSMEVLPVIYDIKNGANPIVPDVFLKRDFYSDYPKGENKFRERTELIRKADPSIFFVISKKDNDNMVVYRILHNNERIYGCGVFWLNFSDVSIRVSPFVTPILPSERIAYSIIVNRLFEKNTSTSALDRCIVTFCAAKNSPFQIQLTSSQIKCLAFSTLLGRHVMPLCIHGEYSHFKYKGVICGCSYPEDKRNLNTKYQPLMEI